MKYSDKSFQTVSIRYYCYFTIISIRLFLQKGSRIYLIDKLKENKIRRMNYRG